MVESEFLFVSALKQRLPFYVTPFFDYKAYMVDVFWLNRLEWGSLSLPLWFSGPVKDILGQGEPSGFLVAPWFSGLLALCPNPGIFLHLNLFQQDQHAVVPSWFTPLCQFMHLESMMQVYHWCAGGSIAGVPPASFVTVTVWSFLVILSFLSLILSYFFCVFFWFCPFYFSCWSIGISCLILFPLIIAPG